MTPIEFVAPYYYNVTYFFTFLIVTWFTILYYVGSSSQKVLRAEGGSLTQTLAFVCTFFFIFYLGLRPVARDFGDMPLYAYSYEIIAEDIMGANYETIGFHSEWFWRNIIVFCIHMGFNVNEYFFLIELGYIGGMFICSMMLMRKNLWLSMLFFFTAFSTYTYGTNGIRNGLACSIILVAMCLLIEKNTIKRLLSFLLMFLALGIHRSTILPSAAAIATVFIVKDTKWAFRFWLISFALSLVLGNAVTELFAALGFDDRFEQYYEGQYREGNSERFSSVGFRWDFWLYSAAPVAMIWYVTRYRRFTDIAYTMFANTYLLCNAFWVIVIRASFSNRFAYLSWFLYPVVIAYPLLRMNLWKEQDRKTAIILFLYSAFLFFMYFIYYFGTTGFKGFDLYWWKKA